MARRGRRGGQEFLPFSDESEGAKWVREEQALLLPKCRNVTFYKGSPRQKTVQFCRKRRSRGLSEYQRFVRDFFKQGAWPTFEDAASDWQLYKDGEAPWPGKG
jgi:hypothetical protein